MKGSGTKITLAIALLSISCVTIVPVYFVLITCVVSMYEIYTIPLIIKYLKVLNTYPETQ